MNKTTETLLLLLIFILFFGCQFQAEITPEKPNFIIVFTDDQGYQDLGCYGSPNIKTPNIDRMAAEGMKYSFGRMEKALERISIMLG